MQCEEIKTVNILLVEDNPADVRLLREAIKEIPDFQNQIKVAIDGEDALLFLHKKENYCNVITPDLIILDLNLPKKDGYAVLAEIKSDCDLRRVPVIIFTTSKIEKDIFKAYDLHANCYINKPVDLDDFYEVVKRIESFWFSTCILPTRQDVSGAN
jgi:two-component system, chemotaxis family, response regulator Rcp1